MAGNSSPPDYDLADRIALTTPAQVKAISHPLRTTILSLLHERAATVTELAVAVERPKSTVAHHVKVLAEAGLVQVVRTRRVRAIEERFYGRTARMFYVAAERSSDGRRPASGLQRLRGRRWGVGRGVPGREAVGVHPARSHLGGCRCRSSGSRWRSWWRSSTSFRGRARPCTDSRSASIPPTIRPYRAVASRTPPELDSKHLGGIEGPRRRRSRLGPSFSARSPDIRSRCRRSGVTSVDGTGRSRLHGVESLKGSSAEGSRSRWGHVRARALGSKIGCRSRRDRLACFVLPRGWRGRPDCTLSPRGTGLGDDSLAASRFSSSLDGEAQPAPP